MKLKVISNHLKERSQQPKPDFADAVIEFSADMNSINTDVEARDKHLKSADFFDAEKNPTLTFKSTSFKKEKVKKYKVTGT